jgi:hypothetical protein
MPPPSPPGLLFQAAGLSPDATKVDIERIDNRTAQKGTSPLFRIPQDAVVAKVALSRETWSERVGDEPIDRDVIEVSIDLSLDNGVTWDVGFIGFRTSGGSPKDRDGVDTIESGVIRKLPPSRGDNPNRILRVSVENFVRLSSTVSISTE